MRISCTPGELGGHMGRLIDDVNAAVLRGLRSSAARGVGVVVEQIQIADAVNTGQLMQSVTYEDHPQGADVSANAPHAAFLEFGTRPHYPPIAPIFEWVMRRLRPAATEKRSAEQVGWGIARAICEKIAANGTRPRYFMRKARQRIENDIVPVEIDREIGGV